MGETNKESAGGEDAAEEEKRRLRKIIDKARGSQKAFAKELAKLRQFTPAQMFLILD